MILIHLPLRDDVDDDDYRRLLLNTFIHRDTRILILIGYYELVGKLCNQVTNEWRYRKFSRLYQHCREIFETVLEIRERGRKVCDVRNKGL